ncbi:MAG: zinc-ribbon domain-containing protein [Candidatus Asgardarchaeia archaeon]
MIIKETIVKIFHEEIGNETEMMDFNHMMGDFGQSTMFGFPVMYLGMALAFISVILVIYILLRAVERGNAPTVIAVTTPANSAPVTQSTANHTPMQRPVPSVPNTYTCPNCGNPVPPNAQYCPTCGFKLTSS